MYRHLIAAALLVVLAACQLPKDPENTTDTVQGAVLDAEIEWHRENPHQMLDALEGGDLHLLAGGIPKDSPLTEHTGMTNPIGYVTVGADRPERVLLLRRGENRFLMRSNMALRPLTREAQE
jgi:hypothetical protein